MALARPAVFQFDQNGWHIIIFEGIQLRPDGTGYLASLDEAQFEWLRDDSQRTPS